jgi:ribonucleoside-triphosphate reductase (thioredoxin)
MTLRMDDTSIAPDSSEPLLKAVPKSLTICKRDGETLQEFDVSKLRSAISKAWKETKDSVDEQGLTKVVNSVLTTLSDDDGPVHVETVQDAVEIALMRQKQYDIAKAFILYRHQRSEARLQRIQKTPDGKAISNYIHAGKYARYIPDLKRRETYLETVDRVEGMHAFKYPHMKEEIKWAFDLVRAKRILPSMRSMQFGGAAVLSNNNRIYNCSFSLVDRMEVFAEALYLLLSGTGVGYSVQFDHVEKLPKLSRINQKSVRHHVIEDTIEGWAEGLQALIQSYLDGVNLELSYHLIRAAGVPLKTSGGKAPGHLQLKVSLERIRLVLNAAQGRKLRPIECHRIMCHAADAVLSGGIRRSAMISLFSIDDSEMINVKTSDWYVNEPWLANANNSVVLKRDEVKKKQFRRIFEMTKQWGEPGFYFTNNYDYGTNPCCEIGLNPRLVIDEETRAKLIARRAMKSALVPALGSVYTGWAFCNLCEINAAKMTSLEDFLEVGKAATLIGTLQAGYTKMPFLGWVSEMLAEREALLGIGMTGMMDAPSIACNPDFQREVATKIKEWNIDYAQMLGVNPAARTTCVKPSGTTSLELEGVASGHHPHHAKRFIRRVIADELEPIFQAFKAVNPHMCVRKPDGKWVIQFPVEAPSGAIVKEDVSAIAFLDMVKSTQQNWVLEGTSVNKYSPGLNHNVSNTVVVRPEEWDGVQDYLWENREFFTGVALLPSSGDKDYSWAPMEAIETPQDELVWNRLLEHYVPIDYSSLVEESDETDLKGEVACAGGVCSIV